MRCDQGYMVTFFDFRYNNFMWVQTARSRYCTKYDTRFVQGQNLQNMVCDEDALLQSQFL